MTMLAYLCLLDILVRMNHATISVIGEADNDNPADPDSPGLSLIPYHLTDPACSRLSELANPAGASR